VKDRGRPCGHCTPRGKGGSITVEITITGIEKQGCKQLQGWGKGDKIINWGGGKRRRNAGGKEKFHKRLQNSKTWSIPGRGTGKSSING